MGAMARWSLGNVAHHGPREVLTSARHLHTNGREMVTIDAEFANALEIVFFHCEFEILMCHVCCMSHVELTMA